MTQYFRDSGFEKEALVASVTGIGEIVAAPGAGKSIYILGVNAYANTLLKETNGSGNTILTVAAGNCNLPATVRVASNTAIHNTIGTYVSIMYYIE